MLNDYKSFSISEEISKFGDCFDEADKFKEFYRSNSKFSKKSYEKKKYFRKQVHPLPPRPFDFIPEMVMPYRKILETICTFVVSGDYGDFIWEFATSSTKYTILLTNQAFLDETDKRILPTFRQLYGTTRKPATMERIFQLLFEFTPVAINQIKNCSDRNLMNFAVANENIESTNLVSNANAAADLFIHDEL
jgi:hypothetical protein